MEERSGSPPEAPPAPLPSPLRIEDRSGICGAGDGAAEATAMKQATRIVERMLKDCVLFVLGEGNRARYCGTCD